MNFVRNVVVATGGVVVAALPQSMAWADSSAPAEPAPTPDTAAPAETPAPVTATSNVTLPLFGAPLTVDVSTGPGGALASVNITPADTLTAATDRPQKVAFVNTDGTAKVVVRARDGGQRVEAKAGTLAEVSGPGSWSGDVFGTGATTTVTFDVVADANGAPTLANLASTDPTAVIGAPAQGQWHDDEVAHALVTFTNGTQQRFLWIAVRSDTVGGRQYATVSVSLSELKGVRTELAALVGPQQWNGALCDGAPAQINYTINEDGTISDATSVPAADVRVERGRLKVRFSEREAVKISVRGDEAESRIAVDERMRCDFGPPAVNTPVEPGATDPGRHGPRPGWGDHGSWGDRGDHDKGWGDRGDHDKHSDRDGTRHDRHG
ncbi:MAG: hypothetical protein AB7R77_01080 [Ilumatobacteraceae bacterium]